MSKRLIGYGYTNANGVATLDYDAEGNELQSSGYVGQGVGNVDISASAVIDGSTFVSETYSILDCYKYDNGNDSTHNIWTTGTDVSLTYGNEYATMEETTIGTTATCNLYSIPLTNYRVEFDVFQVDGTTDENCCLVYTSDWSPINAVKSKLGEWKHISFDMENIDANSRFRLATQGSCTTLRFKNFRIYPI